ncbi:unnamed protein product [Prorocentrum cordatum]|uniref:Calmodulin n=1 Tax=Prorocentrum cordatum TaxID=2364126 RepID=A0ABN9R6A4_9DINO|nr:unnamed protein product [Polarella glacialis]
MGCSSVNVLAAAAAVEKLQVGCENSTYASSPMEGLFTPEQVADVRDLYVMFTGSPDREIDRSDFMRFTKMLGLSLPEEDAHALFNQMDSGRGRHEGNGRVDFEELMAFLQTMAVPMSLHEELSDAFEFMTLASDGPSKAKKKKRSDPKTKTITKRELAASMESMGEKVTEADCAAMIRAVTGGRDLVDFDTFARLCSQGQG